jgi:hypothetical protein
MCKFNGVNDDNYKTVHGVLSSYVWEIKKNVGQGPSIDHITLSESLIDLLKEHLHLNLTKEVVLVDEVIRGCGGFADVYFGRHSKTDKYVAVKQLRVHIQREEQLSKASNALFPCSVLNKFSKNISRELRIWSSLDHPNILPLLGFTLRGNASFAFICEWMENGTLREYLKKHKEADIFQMV